MIKKTICLLLFIFSCTHMFSLKSETSPKELLRSKILAAEEMYTLGQAIDTLELKKDLLRKQLRPKETLSIGNIVGSALAGGLISTPLMAVNFLNQRTVPVEYQGFLDKTTLGVMALIGARLGYVLAKKGTFATYDYFTYDEKMRLIKKDISTTDAKISQFRDMLEKMTTNYAAIFSSIKLSSPEELICEKLIDLYKKNNRSFTLDELNAYFNNDKNDIAEQVLRLFELKKADMIFELYSKNKRVNDFPSLFSGNLSTLGIEMILGIMALPWLLALTALGSSTKASYTKQNNENIKLIDEIIKNLKMLQ